MRYLLITLFFLFIGCQKQDNFHKEKFPKIHFDINKSLISESYLIDNNFTLSVPIDVFQNNEVFNKLNKQMESDTSSYFDFSLIETFNSENILLYIGKINENNLFSKLDSNYNKALRNTYKVEELNIGQYNLNDLNVFQYIFNDDTSVTIKLYINNLDNFYEITYIVNRLIYKNYLKHIESSIGSININKK